LTPIIEDLDFLIKFLLKRVVLQIDNDSTLVLCFREREREENKNSNNQESEAIFLDIMTSLEKRTS